MYEVGGIHVHTPEFQLVYLHLPAQQRHELHADHELPHIGNGVSHLRQRVVGFYHLEVFHSEVERKLQIHPAHGDLHSSLLRGIVRHAVYRPVLHRRQIEQHRQQYDEEYRSGKSDECPAYRISQ